MATTSPDRAAPVDGSVLCLACGLCCDGTLFRHTELADDEVDAARSVGAPLIRIGGDAGTNASAIPQRCALFQEGCCSTFGRWRPKACFHYTCELLDGFVLGQRALDDCLEVVRSFREVAGAVQSLNLEAAADPARAPEARRTAGLREVLRRMYFDPERKNVLPGKGPDPT